MLRKRGHALGGQPAPAAVDARLRDEGIRNQVSIVVGGGVRNSGDAIKAIALGADGAPDVAALLS